MVAGNAPRRPRAVAFDVNETLFGLDRLGDAFEAAGLPGTALDLWFARTLRDGFAMAATDDLAAFDELGRHHLAHALRSFGLASDDRTVATIMAAFRELEAYEDVRPAFERLLDEDVPIVTLTVGDAEITEELLRYNGLDGFVERCFDAASIGAWKPRGEPYHHVAAKLGVEPSQLALVAVHSWDVHGAKRAGLTAGWVSRLEGVRVPPMAAADVSGRTLVEVVDGLLALPA